MRLRCGPGAALIGILVLAGCAAEAEKPPPAPMPTDGPDQAVFYVPQMV